MAGRLKLVALTLAVIAFVIMGGSCKSPIDPQAEKQFRKSLGSTSITVYPTVTRNPKLGYDEASQQKLAAYFTDAKLATITSSTIRVEIPTKPGHNQSTMWRESAESFSEYIRRNQPSTEYALIAEFLLNQNGEPIGIHTYVTDANGVLAYGVGLNSHHEVFARNKPKTPDDAVKTLIEHLKNELGGK